MTKCGENRDSSILFYFASRPNYNILAWNHFIIYVLKNTNSNNHESRLFASLANPTFNLQQPYLDNLYDNHYLFRSFFLKQAGKYLNAYIADSGVKSIAMWRHTSTTSWMGGQVCFVFDSSAISLFSITIFLCCLFYFFIYFYPVFCCWPWNWKGSDTSVWQDRCSVFLATNLSPSVSFSFPHCCIFLKIIADVWTVIVNWFKRSFRTIFYRISGKSAFVSAWTGIFVNIEIIMRHENRQVWFEKPLLNISK